MQTHKQKYPAKDLKAIESKIFSQFKLKATIYFGATLFMASLTAYKVLLTRETSPRQDCTFLTFTLILYLSWASLKINDLWKHLLIQAQNFDFFQQLLLFYALSWVGQLVRLGENKSCAPFLTLVSL